MATKSFATKFFLLVLSLLLGMIAGNLALLGILSLFDMDISQIVNPTQSEDGEPLGLPIFIGIGVSHLLLFVGSALIFWKIATKDRFKKYFSLTVLPKYELLGWFILLLFASYPLVGASGMLGHYVEFPEWMQSMDSEYAEVLSGILAGDGVGKLLLNLLVIAVLPAIGEELIFRGIVQKELHKVISNPHLVILITSIIFSGIHLQAEGFLPKLLISYLLCYTYYWTKSLWYPMILHFINNGSMTLALYFGKEQMETLENIDSTDFPWGGVVISLFLCTVIVRKVLKALEDDNELQKGQLANE